MKRFIPSSLAFRYPYRISEDGSFAAIINIHPAILAFIIFIFALAFRYPAAHYGLPYIHYWDEPAYLKLSLQMMKSGDFDHQWYNIPPFFLYQHTLAQTALFLNTSKIHPYDLEAFSIDVHNREVSTPAIPLWSRRWTALLGAASCALLFLIFRNKIPESIAILAGFLLALFPGHIEQSVLVTADIPLQFMVLLTLGTTFQLNHENKFWPFFTSGLLVGLCAATKYNGIIAAVIPLSFLLSKKIPYIATWLAVLLGIIAGFTFGFPYWLIKFPEFISGFAWEMYHYNNLFEMAGVSNYFGLTYISDLFFFGLGPIFFLFFLIGLIYFEYSKSQLTFLQLNAFPLLYCFWLLSQSSNYIRNLTPLFPWLALYTAYGFVMVWRFIILHDFFIHRRHMRLNILFTFLILIFLQPIILTFSLSTSEETRTRAINWIDQQLPSEQIIAIPADLHFLSAQIQKLPHTIIELQNSNIHQQTLSAINTLVLGKSPTYANPDAPEHLNKSQQKEISAMSSFMNQLPILHKEIFHQTYSRFSSLGKFHEGKWLLNSFSINPSIIIANTENKEFNWIPISRELITIDEYFWQKPSINKTLHDNPIQLKNIHYPYGLGIHGGSKINLKVPDSAKRFVVDVGISHDISTELSPKVNFKLNYKDQVYHFNNITRQSPVYRIDIAVEPQTEIFISTLEPEEEYNADHMTLGYCSFTP